MSLSQAIDALLAHVPGDGPLPQPKRFEELDRAVWVEACQRGYDGKLPQDESSATTQYRGKTKLPGFYPLFTALDAAGNRIFYVMYRAAWAKDLLALRALAEATDPLAAETAAQPGAASDDKEWILVSEAVAQLPFIRNNNALYRFAKEHPDKLHIRPHPKHGRRRQAKSADVLRLEMEHSQKQFDAMGSSAADSLPPISKEDLGPLVERLARIKAGKQK